MRCSYCGASAVSLAIVAIQDDRQLLDVEARCLNCEPSNPYVMLRPPRDAHLVGGWLRPREVMD